MRSEIWSAGTLTLECEKKYLHRSAGKTRKLSGMCAHLCLYVQNAKVGIITQECNGIILLEIAVTI